MSLFEVRLTAYLLLAVGAHTPLAAQRFWPNAEVRRATLSFDGKSTLGDFTGTTAEVRGKMTGGPGPWPMSGGGSRLRSNRSRPATTAATGTS
jgi:hypothetical protein